MSSNRKRRHSDEEDTPQKKGRTKSKYDYQNTYNAVASTSKAFHVNNNSESVDTTGKKETYFVPHDVQKTGHYTNTFLNIYNNLMEDLKKPQKKAKKSSLKRLDTLHTYSYTSATPSTSKQFVDFPSPGPTKNGSDKKVSDLQKLITNSPHYVRLLDELLQKKQKIMMDYDNEHSITKEVNSGEENNMTAEGRPERSLVDVTKTNVVNKQLTIDPPRYDRSDESFQQKQKKYIINGGNQHITKEVNSGEKNKTKPETKNRVELLSERLSNKLLETVTMKNFCDRGNTQQHVELQIETIESRNTLGADEENYPSAAGKITVNESRSQRKYIANETQEIELKNELLKDDEKYHPAYQKFIDTCLKIENSEDMQKIVRIKIKKYYRQCSREYVESRKFIKMVLSAIASIETEPKHLYKHIKKVVDELDSERMLARSQQAMDENAASGSDTKKSKKIRKLQKILTTLHMNIQAFEQQEVDLDDEENSTFLLAERLKLRFVKVHKMFCKLTNAKIKTEPRITIKPREGVPQGPTKRLQIFINKRVPYGAPLPFPDYHDVLKCVRKANDEDGLDWPNWKIEEEACKQTDEQAVMSKYLFEKFGSKLKRRRQLRDREITIVSRITPDCLDPAELDETLRFKLHQNRLTAGLRESEVISSFVEKEIQLKQELKDTISEFHGEVKLTVKSYVKPDKVAVASDEVALTSDKVAVISDGVPVTSEKAAVISDEVAVTSDEILVLSDSD